MSKSQNLYNEYLEKYCITRHLTKEEAELHILVKEMKQFYEELEKEIINDGTNDNNTTI